VIRQRIKEQHTVFAQTSDSGPGPEAGGTLIGTRDALRHFELSSTVGTTDMPGRRM
jgi:hypothetical protein